MGEPTPWAIGATLLSERRPVMTLWRGCAVARSCLCERKDRWSGVERGDGRAGIPSLADASHVSGF